jgi:hypothetical protein
VQARCEEFAAWFLERTPRWPKRARYTLTQRLENHCLDALEDLVIARYSRAERRARLAALNLRLERMRHLLRIARATGVAPAATCEGALRGLDEIGRMLHGWRESAGGRA